MSEHVLFASTFDGESGVGTQQPNHDIAQLIKSTEQLAWVHLDVNHPNTEQWLKTQADYLDPFIIDALLAEETRPRMTQVGDGVLLILRGVNLNDDAAPEDMVSVRLWVDQHRIISTRRRRLKAVVDLDAQIHRGQQIENAGQLVCMLVARLFQRMEPVLSKLDDATDDVEEKVLENADATLREGIVGVRKQAILFRRYMAPQRDAIGQLVMADVPWLNADQKRQLQESYNRVTRYVEDLDTVRERAQIVKDELANILADRLNKNMYVLSVVAAIFLPLGFLTGLLGINVGGVPGVNNNASFWIFCAILITVVALQVAVFKKLKWF